MNVTQLFILDLHNTWLSQQQVSYADADLVDNCCNKLCCDWLDFAYSCL